MSLPTPESINVTALPYVLMDERGSLPNIPAVYFVLNNTGDILYIGRAKSLCFRWQSHHRMAQFIAYKDLKLAWIVVEDIDLLGSLEKSCIDYFSPSLNGPVHGYRESMARPRVITSMRLTPETKSLLARLSDLLGMSQAAVIETLIREKARREKVHTQTRSSRDDPTEPLAASVGR